MYLLYLDDSGSAANKDESHLVLGGICLHESQASRLANDLDELAKEISRTDFQSVEFHAAEIFSGRKPPWNSITNKKDRIEIIKRVLSIVANASKSTCIFACAVHKDSFPQSDPVEIAFEDICSRFDQKLRRIERNGEKHKGIIILDESAHETTLQNLARQFRTQGTRWRNVIKNIADVPLFVDSRRSRCIQLADHIAYSVFRRYHAADAGYIDVILKRFDRDGHTLHGLSHKRVKNDSCACPACFGKSISGKW